MKNDTYPAIRGSDFQTVLAGDGKQRTSQNSSQTSGGTKIKKSGWGATPKTPTTASKLGGDNWPALGSGTNRKESASKGGPGRESLTTEKLGSHNSSIGNEEFHDVA